MKLVKNFIISLFAFPFLVACTDYHQELKVSSCTSEKQQIAFSKENDLQNALDKLVKQGAPGTAMAISTSEGLWFSAAGFSNIEAKTAMEPCHLQYLQSITKTYMAVAVLLLSERDKINLDKPITNYLPEKYSRYVADAEKITVRMLMNHTSGIPDYNFSPAYISFLLQHPDYPFSTEEYLQYIENKPLDFEPGSRHSYGNINYLLLALLTDAVTGDHAQFIAQNIFEPLGLTNTFYRNESGYLDNSNLVNTYWDRYGNGIVENVSKMQKNNVASLMGDDGIVATPAEAVKFLKALMDGDLLSPSSMEQMQTWVQDKEGKPAYGLGLIHTTINGHVAYGHSGGGIGAGCELYYFPEKEIYLFISVNFGTLTESPLLESAEKAREEVYKVLLK